ncbi:hypothetical protein IGI04_009488, partial [Brassica rapa subsp. trilocularis]
LDSIFPCPKLFYHDKFSRNLSRNLRSVSAHHLVVLRRRLASLLVYQLGGILKSPKGHPDTSWRKHSSWSVEAREGVVIKCAKRGRRRSHEIRFQVQIYKHVSGI